MNAKTKRRVFYIASGLVILVLAAMLLPALLPPRFIVHEFLTFKVRVTDKESGAPVAGAKVWVVWKGVDLTSVASVMGETTDDQGTCEVREGFTAKGVFGRSGQFDLTGRRLIIRAQGFKEWERSLDSVFGRSRDYNLEKVVPCGIALEQQHSN